MIWYDQRDRWRQHDTTKAFWWYALHAYTGKYTTFLVKLLNSPIRRTCIIRRDIWDIRSGEQSAVFSLFPFPLYHYYFPKLIHASALHLFLKTVFGKVVAEEGYTHRGGATPFINRKGQRIRKWDGGKQCGSFGWCVCIYMRCGDRKK